VALCRLVPPIGDSSPHRLVEMMRVAFLQLVGVSAERLLCLEALDMVGYQSHWPHSQAICRRTNSLGMRLGTHWKTLWFYIVMVTASFFQCKAAVLDEKSGETKEVGEAEFWLASLGHMTGLEYSV